MSADLREQIQVAERLQAHAEEMPKLSKKLVESLRAQEKLAETPGPARRPPEIP